jgi:hypothetical protein
VVRRVVAVVNKQSLSTGPESRIRTTDPGSRTTDLGSWTTDHDLY